jgi:hypothetical protein
MKAALDTITVQKDGRSVVYVHILDDNDKIIATFSTYYKDKALFEAEIAAKMQALENKNDATITAIQAEVLDVIAKITAAGKG